MSLFLFSSIILFILSQSLDELDDDDLGEKERREEEELVQANTFQNESMTADPVSGHLMVRSDMMGRSRRKQETDYIFSHTVPPVVPCHVVVHREVIHTQKRPFFFSAGGPVYFSPATGSYDVLFFSTRYSSRLQ